MYRPGNSPPEDLSVFPPDNATPEYLDALYFLGLLKECASFGDFFPHDGDLRLTKEAEEARRAGLSWNDYLNAVTGRDAVQELWHFGREARSVIERGRKDYGSYPRSAEGHVAWLLGLPWPPRRGCEPPPATRLVSLPKMRRRRRARRQGGW